MIRFEMGFSNAERKSKCSYRYLSVFQCFLLTILLCQEGCRDGVYSNKFDKTDMTATFTSLGIQCVKKTEVLGSLDERAKLRIDPFKSKSAECSKNF